MTHEEIMKAFCLFPRTLSPAVEFLRNRMNQAKNLDFEENANRALIDLVKSDTPLDGHIRQQIAGELYRLYFPNSRRDKREGKQAQNWAIMSYKNHLVETCGMTATEADFVIVEDMGKALGINSVDALQRRLRPSRK